MPAPILSYCMNVHPGETLAQVLELLRGPVAEVRRAWRGDASMGAGLWLAAPVAASIASDLAAAEKARASLAEANLFAYTVNAFPFGGFHAERVKESVYRPTWADEARLRYTVDAATALARLLPDGAHGSVSTVPIGYKTFDMSEAALEAAGLNLRRAAHALDRIAAEQGREVRLALEPEPLAVLETTAELISFLNERVFAGAGVHEASYRDRLGMCVDTCHLDCAFEYLPDSLAALEWDGIQVPKAQLSSALQLRRPATNAAGRERLRAFAEPRYLHQSAGVIRRDEAVGLAQAGDLEVLFAGEALHPAFAEVEQVRTHFHVPLCWPGDEALSTTRQEWVPALLAKVTDHLEVETYTWDALPAADRARYGDDVVRMLTDELRWAEGCLRADGIEPR